jgi:hypothetical protein
MTARKNTRTYGIETLADATFTLKYSGDLGDQAMAENPHAFKHDEVMGAARYLAKLNIENATQAASAKRLADYNAGISACPF